MSLYSLSFLVFFLIFSIVIHFIPSVKIQHYVFLIANIVFYAFWDYRFLLLVCFIVSLCYVCARFFEKEGKKFFIWGAVIVCLLILCVFKYFDFFSESFARVFGITDYVTLNLVLPLGISFYLFQAMSYLFDVLYGKIGAENDFVKLAVYISFFPQITAGPIVKSKEFLPQLNKLHRIKKENVYEGIQLFLMGLTKKVVFADRIGVAVDAVYSAPLAYNGLSVLLAVIGYSFQIYCDFSGYSNIAIGVAKIWDFDLGENFNAPYIAKNPSDFWRRWHISLSTWFRDYVYIPLGGNRKGKIRTYINLFVTMLLSGIWHGANVTYIVWGAIHGLGSVVHKMSLDIKKTKSDKNIIPDFLKTLLNYIFVSLAWIIFRAHSMQESVSIFRSIFNAKGIMYTNVYVIVYVLILSAFNLYAKYKKAGRTVQINMDLDKFRNKVFICIWAWAIVLFMYCGNSAFIYAQF